MSDNLQRLSQRPPEVIPSNIVSTVEDTIRNLQVLRQDRGATFVVEGAALQHALNSGITNLSEPAGVAMDSFINLLNPTPTTIRVVDALHYNSGANHGTMEIAVAEDTIRIDVGTTIKPIDDENYGQEYNPSADHVSSLIAAISSIGENADLRIRLGQIFNDLSVNDRVDCIGLIISCIEEIPPSHIAH